MNLGSGFRVKVLDYSQITDNQYIRVVLNIHKSLRKVTVSVGKHGPIFCKNKTDALQRNISRVYLFGVLSMMITIS